MEILIVNQQEVARLLPMSECISVMEEALRSLARGEAQLPLRTIIRLPDGNAFAVMPAFIRSPAALGAKAVSVFPANNGTGMDSHQGCVLLFDAENGRILSIMDGSAITAIRTAAVSAVATRVLARAEATSLTILGSAVQARTHADAMFAVRPIAEVHVWSRTPERARSFGEWIRHRHGVSTTVHESAEGAVQAGDIICTVTASHEPVLSGEWVRPGAHINAVGSSSPAAREVDGTAMARSRVFVDRRESALNEAGDFIQARSEGFVGDSDILGELGELLEGVVAGRTAGSDITLFKSLGLAIEDLAAAEYILRKARGGVGGTLVELGGESYAPD